MRTSQPPDEDIVVLLKSFSRRRITRILMYGFLAAGAIVSAIAPSAVLVEQSNSTIAIVWSFSFGIAALTCLVGSIFDRWIAEYTMLPLLATTLIAFGIAMVGQAQGDVGWRIIPYAFFFSAFALGLIARWRDVQALLAVAGHREVK